MTHEASTAKRKRIGGAKSTRCGRATAPMATAETNPWHMLDALPKRRRREIDQAILHRPEGLGSVLKIYKHFELKGENITLASFRRYTDLLAWRTRLGYIGKLVHQLVGAVPDDVEDRWLRAARLIFTATLIEALDQAKGRISITDLIKLAKIFEDRATSTGPRRSKPTETGGDGRTPNGKLPKQFAETVKDIYGVTLNHDGAPADAADAAAPKPTDAKDHAAGRI